MKKILAVLLVPFLFAVEVSPIVAGALPVAVVITSCGSSGTLEQSTATWESGSTDLSLQRLITIVCNKHDEYVNADPTLAPEDRSVQLAESMVVRLAFTVQSVKTATIRAPLNATLDRLDTYVNGDPDITSGMKQMLLFSTANIRRTVSESH